MEGYTAGVTTGIGYHHCSYWANIDFEGSWNAGPITGKPNQYSEIQEYFLEGKIGYDFFFLGVALEPYTGFGWDRFINRKDPDGVGLKYRYDKLFVPIGFFITGSLQNFDLEFQFEFRPDVYKHLEELGIGLTPKWGYGFRSQLAIKQYFSLSRGDLSLSWVPFFDWNLFGKVEESNSVGALFVIPRLERWDLGLRLILGYEW